MDVYYTREGPIPDDQAARLIGVRSKEEREALAAVLQEFFVRDADAWRQSRCDAEIEQFSDKQRKAKASAEARWAHTERNANASPNAMRTHSEGNAPSNQEPITSNQEPKEEKRAPRKRSSPPAVAKPEDVAVKTWADWQTLRKAKRAPITDTVLDGARAEAGKADMSLDAFLQVWCVRGSQGLQADWLKPHERQVQSRVSFAEADEQARRRRWEEMTGRKWPTSGEVIDAETITERIAS
jgi:uncharacterized protein YdaU (DUF1376 family)